MRVAQKSHGARPWSGCIFRGIRIRRIVQARRRGGRAGIIGPTYMGRGRCDWRGTRSISGRPPAEFIRRREAILLADSNAAIDPFSVRPRHDVLRPCVRRIMCRAARRRAFCFVISSRRSISSLAGMLRKLAVFDGGLWNCDWKLRKNMEIKVGY